jgi:hypothetical protein
MRDPPVSADGSLPQQFFPLPPPVADVARLSTWGTQLAQALRKLQAAGAFSGTATTGDDLASLAAALATVQQDIEQLIADMASIVSDGLTEQQKFLLSLTAGVEGILGTMATYNRAAFDWAQKAAEDGGLALLKGHIDRGIGRTIVINEQTVRQSETDALAQSVTTVNANLAQTNANVTAVQQAYVAGDQALAQNINTVSTNVAGNTASITSLTASYNGVAARWGVSVNAQGQVLGTVQLDGGASGSTFTAVVNNFQVAQPSVTGGTAIPVFVIGNVAGVPKIGIRGDMFIDGTVLARHMSVGTLDAISANVGTLTAGVLRDSADTYRLTISTGKLGRTDNTSFIDFANNILQFTTAT